MPKIVEKSSSDKGMMEQMQEKYIYKYNKENLKNYQMNFQNKRNFRSSIKYLIIYIVTDIKILVIQALLNFLNKQMKK